MRLPKLFFYRFCIAFFSYWTGKLVETWQQCSMSTFLTPNTYMMADSFEHRAFKSTHWSDPPPSPLTSLENWGGGGRVDQQDRQTNRQHRRLRWPSFSDIGELSSKFCYSFSFLLYSHISNTGRKQVRTLGILATPTKI